MEMEPLAKEVPALLTLGEITAMRAGKDRVITKAIPLYYFLALTKE